MMRDKVLKDRYKIIEYIGCGGMAEVYTATDMLLERTVAVKILRPQFSNDENFIGKFRREAQAAANLNHNNIVSIFDVGTQDDIHYIIMEYVSGETLQKIIQKKAPLQPLEAIYIAKDIAKALMKAHSKGIVHCDIKPHNILMDESGVAKVSDFGIARAISSTTVTFDGAILGSVHYLSPEQARGEAVTFSSDIYSLGVVLFEMLTGKLPFTGETPISVAMQHVQSSPPLLRDMNDRVPAVLESVVSKALSKNPEDRYTASDFIRALKIAQEYVENESSTDIGDATMLIDKIVVPEKNKDKNKREKIKELLQHKSAKYIALVALLVLGFATGMFMVFGGITGEVRVPNVIGKERSDAVNILKNSKLDVEIVEEFDNKVPFNFVAFQNPESGSIVKTDRKITITISKGPELVNVPDFTGKDISEVYTEVAKLSLRMGKVEEKPDKEKKPGTVIAQNPAPPANIGVNSYIDFIVAAPEAKNFMMPDLAGLTANEAKNRLQQLKLKVRDIEDRYTANYPPGIVVEHVPSAGQSTVEGTEVTLVVARSLNEQAKQGIVEFVVPAGSGGQSVKIVVTDNRSRRTVYEGTHNQGERIRKTVDGVGSMRVQFFSNGRLVEEKYI